VRILLRADEGFWGNPVLSGLEEREITYAVGAPLIASVKQRISEVPEAAWGPCCYREGSQVAQFSWRPKTCPSSAASWSAAIPSRRASNNLHAQIFNANWAYLLLALIAHDLLVWLKLLALPEAERASYAKRLRFRFSSVAGSVGRSGRRLVLRLQAGYALFGEFVEALTRIRNLATA